MTLSGLCGRIAAANATVIRVALGLSLLLASAAGATAQPVPVTINVIIDQTGGGAFAGKTEMDALQVFQSWTNQHGGINGQPLHFEFYDDQTDARVAVQLANQVLAKGPSILLGLNLTAMCAAVAPLVEANGPVTYCFTPGYSPKPRGYIFGAAQSIDDLVAGWLNLARGKGLSRIGYVTTTVASGQIADAALKRDLSLPQYKNINIADFESFNPDDLSIVAQVARLKAADVQVIITPVFGPGFAMLLRTMHDAGLNVPLLGSSANLVVDQLKSYKSFLPPELYMNGLVYYARDMIKPGPLRNAIDDFSAAFKAAGVTFTPISGQAWDPALIVTSALKRLGTKATAAQVRNYILSLHDFPGVSGMYDFRKGNPHGLNSDSVIFVKWNGDRSDFANATKFGGAPL